MGLERIVRLPADSVMSWPTIAERLASAGVSPPVIRMIDGLPAFPDETPANEWRELRLGIAGGMVTLRRTATEVRVIVWGTADPELLRARDACCWAIAESTGGTVFLDDGSSATAEAFHAAHLC